MLIALLLQRVRKVIPVWGRGWLLCNLAVLMAVSPIAHGAAPLSPAAGSGGAAPSGFSLSGSVKFADGKAIASALVEARQGGQVIGSANTDWSGQYSIANLAPGNYNVRARVLSVYNYVNVLNPKAEDVSIGAGNVSNINIEFPLPTLLLHGFGCSSAEMAVAKRLLELDPTSSEKYGHKAYIVYAPDLGPYASVDDNVKRLQVAILTLKATLAPIGGAPAKVNIVAHSMGGLVSRKYIAESSHSDVAKLVMLGTPNTGSKTANLSLPWGWLIYPIIPALWNLTTDYLQYYFNPFINTSKGAKFYYFAGDGGSNPIEDFPNDGIVSRASVFGSPVPGTQIRRPDVHAVLRESPETLNLVMNALEDWPLPTVQAQSPAEDEEPDVDEPIVKSDGGLMLAHSSRTITVTLDTADKAYFILDYSSMAAQSDLSLVLTDPDGRQIDRTVAASDPLLSFDAMETEPGDKFQEYEVTLPHTGIWTLGITSTGNISAPGVVYFATVTISNALNLQGQSQQELYQPGEPAVITATLAVGQTPLPGAQVSVQVSNFDTRLAQVSLFDDGAHQDGGTNDGLYGGVFSGTAVGGVYTLDFAAKGLTPDGESFERMQVDAFTVITPTAKLSAEFTDEGQDEDANGRYDLLDVRGSVVITEAGDYEIAASLFDRDGKLIDSTVAEITAAEPGVYTFTLEFDGETIGAYLVDGPYTAKDITVFLDKAHHTVIADVLASSYMTRPYAARQFEGVTGVYLPLVCKN